MGGGSLAGGDQEDSGLRHEVPRALLELGGNGKASLSLPVGLGGGAAGVRPANEAIPDGGENRPPANEVHGDAEERAEEDEKVQNHHCFFLLLLLLTFTKDWGPPKGKMRLTRGH